MKSVFLFDKADVLGAVRAQRARTIAILEDLTEKQWATEVVPRWRTREVAAHLITTDSASLTGKYLAWGIRQRPMAQIEEWNDGQVARWAERPTADLLNALEKWGRRFSRAMSVPPRRVASVTFPSAFGRVSLLWLALLRVYDEWVHLQDVTRALALPGDDEAGTLRQAARFLLAGIPIQTLPSLPDGAVGTVEVGFTDVDTARLGVDLGTKRYGLGLSADAHVEGPASTLIMVAAGRDPWRDAEAAGHLRVTGDRKAAETLLDALRVV